MQTYLQVTVGVEKLHGNSIDNARFLNRTAGAHLAEKTNDGDASRELQHQDVKQDMARRFA